MTVLRILVKIRSYILLLLLGMIGRTEGYGFKTREKDNYEWTEQTAVRRNHMCSFKK